MKRVKIEPSFINSYCARIIEEEKGVSALRALYGALDVISSRSVSTDGAPNPAFRNSVTAYVFLDELKYKTKMMHQNKLESFLEYCNDCKIIGYRKDEIENRYTLFVDKTTMFFEMD